jgi:hypothetical protein
MNNEDIAYLRQGAQQRGYNADDMLRVINYESSGREGVWGGKNNGYYGLIQFGGPERAKYHIDTQHPNAHNQIDGFFQFLNDRGFRPGMSLLDMYSTVNAGSPGHYNASDGNGNVRSHVARMMHMSPLGATMGNAVASNGAPTDGNVPIPPRRDREALELAPIPEAGESGGGGGGGGVTPGSNETNFAAAGPLQVDPNGFPTTDAGIADIARRLASKAQTDQMGTTTPIGDVSPVGKIFDVNAIANIGRAGQLQNRNIA